MYLPQENFNGCTYTQIHASFSKTYTMNMCTWTSSFNSLGYKQNVGFPMLLFFSRPIVRAKGSIHNMEVHELPICEFME